MLGFSKKLIETTTTSNFFLKVKENNENDMPAKVFWAVFLFQQMASHIGPTADFDGAAIPPPIFSMSLVIKLLKYGHSFNKLQMLAD